jgi:hypothetical protein
MRIRGSRLSLLAVAPVLAAGLLAGPPAGAVTAGACRSWNGSQPVNPSPNGLNQLESIAAVSACDVWAVGSTDPGNGSGEQAVIEHWTGGAWAVSQIPPLAGVSRIELSGVSASASGAWAVGDATNSGTGVARTLTLHWDGAHWARVASPNPDNLNDHLESVDVLSASDAWAVGSASGDTAPLALQWNGSQWVSRQFPPGGGHVELIAVSAVSDSDVWALGHVGPGGPPVMYHWDGSHWIQKTLTVPPGDQLTGLTAVAGNDAWAAGFQGSGLQQTLVMHWDGSGWNPVPSPNPGVGGDLSGVDAVSATSAWAVGEAGIYQQQGGPDHPFVLHWDGRSWAGAAVNARVREPATSCMAWPCRARPGLDGRLGRQPHVRGAGASGARCDRPGRGRDDRDADDLRAGYRPALGHTTNCPASQQRLVVATDPPRAGAVRHPVGLTVCDGPTMMTVPNVRTFDDASARSTITAAGLTVGTLTMTPDCTLSAGDVLSQSPSAVLRWPARGEPDRVNRHEGRRQALHHRITARAGSAAGGRPPAVGRGARGRPTVSLNRQSGATARDSSAAPGRLWRGWCCARRRRGPGGGVDVAG